MDIPSTRIFNCDETYVSLCPPSEKVLLDKGCRSAYKVVDSEKEGFTVLFMYSANGDRAPPMFMFPYKAEVPEKIAKNFIILKPPITPRTKQKNNKEFYATKWLVFQKWASIHIYVIKEKIQ